MLAKPRARPIGRPPEGAHTRRVRGALALASAACDVPARLAADPVRFARRFEAPADRELVALLAATFAFGNVVALGAKIDDALARLGPNVAEACSDRARLRGLLAGFRHRLYRDADVVALLWGARRLQEAEGSLGQAFASRLRAAGSLRGALAEWVDTIREGGLASRSTRGARHLLPDPRGASASKRLLLFLRWMIRADDGVDLGAWSLPPSVLVVPVDTHILRAAQNLGLTRARTATWAAAEEITAALRLADPLDPVRFDFPLCHALMVRRCPSRADADACAGCPLREACVHWRGKRSALLPA